MPQFVSCPVVEAIDDLFVNDDNASDVDVSSYFFCLNYVPSESLLKRVVRICFLMDPINVNFKLRDLNELMKLGKGIDSLKDVSLEFATKFCRLFLRLERICLLLEEKGFNPRNGYLEFLTKKLSNLGGRPPIDFIATRSAYEFIFKFINDITILND